MSSCTDPGVSFSDTMATRSRPMSRTRPGRPNSGARRSKTTSDFQKPAQQHQADDRAQQPEVARPVEADATRVGRRILAASSSRWW